MSTKKYDNDFKLIDGDKIVRKHKTQYNLEKFMIVGLEKIKFLAMHIALSEEQADNLLDCLIDEHFAFGGDMRGFENFVERVGSFLDYYIDKLLKTEMNNVNETIVPNIPDRFQLLDGLEDDEDQPF